MGFLLIPRYEDLIDEPIVELNEILLKIPTKALLTCIAVLNARIDAKVPDIDTIKFFFYRIPLKLREVLPKIIRFYRSENRKFSVFSKIHLCRLAIASVANPNLSEEDTTPEEDWLIFKAYLLLINQYNEDQENILNRDFNNQLDPFNNLAWPSITDQYQFQSPKMDLFDMMRTLTLVDGLLEMNYEQELKKYSTQIGLPILDYIVNLFNIINDKNYIKLGERETPSFFFKIDEKYSYIFSDLVIDIEKIANEEGFNDNYLALKKYPLLSLDNGNYIILNRDFLRNKIYNGLLFDFYNRSGIKSAYKIFADFKSKIGKEIAEKRLFKSLLTSIYSNTHHICIFSENDSHPDCYLRDNHRIFLIEFKDYMMSSKVIQSFDADKFKNEIDLKFVQNEKGRPKGVSQLANQVKSLWENEYEFDPIYTRGFKKSKIEIYPLVIYTDYQYSIPGINKYLSEIFLNLIDSEIKFKNVYEPVLININFLFLYSQYIPKNRLDNLIKAYLNKKKIKEKELHKQPTPDKWFHANLSFDDIGISIDKTKKSKIDFLETYRKNLGLNNLI